MPPKAHFSIWYFVIVFLLFTLAQQYILSPKVEMIPYSKFKQYLAEGPVSSLIIPRGIAALGYTQQQPTEDRYLMTRSELLDGLAVFLGGRATEELVFGEISTGAQNDLQRATDIARSMITEYGKGDRLGLVTYERERRPMFLPDTFSAGKTYSEARAAQIDEEISNVIEEAHKRVGGILSERRKVLDDLAHLLLEKEAVQGDELREMLSKSKAGIAASLPEPLS